MKTKYSVDKQIDHMKKLGIEFNRFSEEQAKDFLTFNTYYFKLKAYQKSFEKNRKTKKYIRLDFAYLVEISTLDTHLRNFILDLSLSIEHSLKTQLIREITINPQEDGYNIVKQFLSKYPYIEKNIKNKQIYNSACGDLCDKYNNNWPAWAIVEVLSFGEFIKLYGFYFTTYHADLTNNIVPYLWSLKFIRNAAAHNNCLLNSLRIPYTHRGEMMNGNYTFKPTKKLITTIMKLPNHPKNTVKYLSNPIIHDFVASLFLLDEVCKSEAMKKSILNDLSDLWDKRFLRHKDYFSKNELFKSRYYFIKYIIDYLKTKI